MAHKWAKWVRHPCRLGDPHRLRVSGKIRIGPQVGKVATSPLPSRGSPPLQSGGETQKWPTYGQSGYVTPAISGIPTASKRGEEIRSGPLVGNVATSPLPSRGSPPLQSGGQNQKWPTLGKVATQPLPSRGSPPLQSGREIKGGPQVGKVGTSPVPSRGSPPLESEWENPKWPTSGQSGYVTPAVSGIPTASERGGNSEVAHLWAKWLCHPCHLGDPHRFKTGGGNQKWPTCGQRGYVTPAFSGIPTASERGAKSEVAHLWAKWVRHPCRLGDAHRFRAGVGGNQKWPTCGQTPCVTPAVSGIPGASERVGKSEVAHLWAKWLRHPCRLGDPQRFRAGRKIKSAPQVGKVATSPLPSRGSPPLQSGGQNEKWPIYGQSGYVTPAVSGISTAVERGPNQKWPTCGQSGYVTPAVWGIHTASERGGKSETAHLWAKWLRHPCRLGDPHRCRAGGKIKTGPQVGKVAMSPLPSRGSPLLQSGGGNQKWPTCGQTPSVTPAVSGIPTASEWVGKSEVAHLWAKWLRHPCRLGDCHRFRAGRKIKSGPQVGKVATSPLPSRGCPPLQSGGQNQKWPIYGQSGYVTPAVSGIPTAVQRGPNQKWPTCGQSGYVTPCRLGDPHRIRAGREIRNGSLVGKVATSPLPSRGCPPLQSGWEN